MKCNNLSPDGIIENIWEISLKFVQTYLIDIIVKIMNIIK